MIAGVKTEEGKRTRVLFPPASFSVATITDTHMHTNQFETQRGTRVEENF